MKAGKGRGLHSGFAIETGGRRDSKVPAAWRGHPAVSRPEPMRSSGIVAPAQGLGGAMPGPHPALRADLLVKSGALL